jgi:exosortase K
MRPESGRDLQSSALARILLGILAVGGACLLKLHFGQADGLQLAWLLRPTAALVALLSGLEFFSHGVEGFHNAARNVLIAPACSGVNFLAICLVTGALPGLMRLRSLAGQLGWLLLIAASAYLLTLLVNTGRILLAIELLQLDVYGELLTRERLHRVEGVVIYYLFLCFFSAALSTMLNPAPAGQKGAAVLAKRLSLSTALWPLVCYLAFSLGLPLLNGAYRQHPNRFVEHGLTVLLCSGGLGLMVGLAARLWSRKRQRGHNHNSAYETNHTHC